MAAAPPPPSKDTTLCKLPYDLQIMIRSLIPCSVDRGLTMSLVRREWRDMIHHHRVLRNPHRFPALPWLLLLTASAADGSTDVACVLGGCPGIHRRCLTVDPPGARVFASHAGGWLLLHYRDGEARGNRAHNVRDGAVERLPAELLVSDGRRFPDMVVLAAALSSPPDDAGCVAAARVAALWPDPPTGAVPVPLRLRCLAFWRKGWELAREQAPPDASYLALEVEHIVYHDGAFHMITHLDHVRVCKPTIEHQDGDGLSLSWTIRRFRPGDVIRDQCVRARYLVVSRGKLLLVVRFTAEPDESTSKFKVYRETKPDVDVDDAAAAAKYGAVAEYSWAWRELETLDGRILFVGQGCTRSYEVNQYPGLISEGIYFLDDGRFYNEQVILGVGNLRQYPCRDNGKWSPDEGIQRCFPEPQPSDHSPPAWLLP